MKNKLKLPDLSGTCLLWVSVSMPILTREKLKALARAKNLSLENFVGKILKDHVENEARIEKKTKEVFRR